MQYSNGTPCGFNSMIVRLKGDGSQRVRTGRCDRFQFYDSPIKSPLGVQTKALSLVSIL